MAEFRNYEYGASATPPSAPATPSYGYPTKGNPGTGAPATKPGEFFYYKVSEELRKVLTDAGLTPSDANLGQLSSAIQILIDQQSGNYALDTGSVANAYVVALNPAVTAYTDGMTVRFKTARASTNTTPTLDAGGGPVTLVNDQGAALAAGDVIGVVTAVYDAATTKWWITHIVQSQALSQAAAAALFAPLSSASTAVMKNLYCGAPGTNAAMTITADKLVLSDASGNHLGVSNVNLSPSLAASGLNGLDTGTVAANTGYYVWTISNGTTTGAIFSLSSTAPTMPAGYIYKSLISWVMTDGTANKFPLNFVQFDRDYQYRVKAGSNLTAPRQMAAGGTGGAVSLSSFAPANIAAVKVSIGWSSVPATGTATWAAPTSEYTSTAAPISITQTSGTGSAIANMEGEFLLEATYASGIYYGSTASTGFMNCLGFKFNF